MLQKYPVTHNVFSQAFYHKQHPTHPLARRVRVQASAYTQPAQQAIRNAQREACRQGSMFLAPQHLLEGLLDTEGCKACQLLVSAGLSAAAAEATLVDPAMVPSSSSMTAGELHWAPDARNALQVAAEAAQEAGQHAAGTPHLLLGLLDCGSAPVQKVLDKAGAQVSVLRDEAEAAAVTCDEPVSTNEQPVPADMQAAMLVQQYKQWVVQHGSTPPSAGDFGGQVSQPPAKTPEDDDIYE